MSIKATNWAYTQDLPAPAKAVLVALAWRTNDKSGDCYPSRAALERMTGLGNGTVKRALRDLEEAGLIRIVHRACKLGHMSNGYVICMPEKPKGLGQSGPRGRATQYTSPHGPERPKGWARVAPNKKDTTTKGSEGRKAQQVFSQEDWDLVATHEGGTA